MYDENESKILICILSITHSFTVLKHIRGWMCGNFWINECNTHTRNQNEKRNTATKKRTQTNDRNREEIKQYYLWMFYPSIEWKSVYLNWYNERICMKYMKICFSKKQQENIGKTFHLQLDGWTIIAHTQQVHGAQAV